MKSSLVAVCLLLCGCSLKAQEFRATVSGTVTDPAGAAVENVKVVAQEQRTGTKSETITSSAGKYTIPFLAPGTYRISAEFAGFKQYVRNGVTLESQEQAIIDVALQLGQASEMVSVTADVSLVNMANASTGQTITTKQVENLPVNGRTPMMLAQLSIGVIPEGNPSLVHPFDNGAAAAFSMGGSKIQSSEILLDGSPDATWDGRLAYSPPMDAVQEVQVQAFNTDAAYGHTSAGTANQILKTGTNQFHGSAYEFNETSALAATPFFSNRADVGKPTLHYNQYGVTAGAPVILPKLYDGRNKLFWFFAWEGLKDNNPTTVTTTVPTAAERAGDFSSLLALGSSYQIYNPFTGTQSGTSVKRQAFSGNKISQSLLNPVALAYLNLYPQPNTTGAANGEFNYVANSPSIDNYNNELGRLDYNIGERDKAFFDFRHNVRSQNKGNIFNNVATGSLLNRENWGASLDEVHTFSPTTVSDIRLNFTRMTELHSEPSAGFDPTTLGFPSYIASNSQRLQLPFISFGSCGSFTSYQCLGDTGASNLPSETYQLFGDLTKVVGKHTLKFGADGREARLSNISFGNAAGSYTFGTNWTTGPTATAAAAPFGQDLAGFLLGLPTSGQYDINAYSSLQAKYFGLFLQDDYRIKSNLIINLGIRFERDLPLTERFNRAVNGFDSTTANPLASAAQAAYAAAYAKNPSAYPLTPAQFNVNGGLTFASASNPAIYETDSHLVSPRIGFSWSPAVFHSRTVIRGGYGIFVSPVNQSTLVNIAANGNVSSTPVINQEGFSQTTSLTVPSSFLAPAATLTNPYPKGIQTPAGSSLGLATYAGQNLTILNPKMLNPYSQRWEFDLQQSLTSNLLLEVAYIGNHAVHLPIPTTQLNAIPRQYLSTSNYRDVADNAVINFLGGSVANPFSGLVTNGALASTTVAPRQLLAPYPQFLVGTPPVGSGGVLLQNNTAGSSYFHSLNVRLEKRLSASGLSVIANYMYSKLMERDTYLNDTDTSLEKRISPFDHPNHVVVGFTYQLPIGTGKAIALHSNWANTLLGGWNVNGIYVWQIGAPIYFPTNTAYVYCTAPNPACNGFGGQVSYDARQANTNVSALNRGAFDTNSADQPQYNIRTFSSTFGNIRQDGTNNLDASLLKNFTFTESTYVQLRFEAFNAFNHAAFAAPSNLTPTASSFGVITQQANNPRQIQVGARFVW